MKLTPLRLEDIHAARKLLFQLGVSAPGIEILAPKTIFYLFKVEDISSWEANIIKQEMLSLGGDAALNRDVLVKECRTTIVISGTVSQLKKLAVKLQSQPFGLSLIGRNLTHELEALCARMVWKTPCKKFTFDRPLLCGILNVTDDSFSGDGLLKEKDFVEASVRRAEDMLARGADILDIGAESTRPFAKPVSAKEEIKRLVPVLKAVRQNFPKAVISIDTYKYVTAQACIQYGIDIVNDISGLRYDKKMAGLIKREKLACVIMHMQNTPQTMQIKPRYKDVMGDLQDFFSERLGYCDKHGIDRENIAIDPGIGFGKRVEDNLKIINNLDSFKIFQRPVFIGLSRKSFIAKTLNMKENSLSATMSAAVMAFMRGADILRVHDVAQVNDSIKMAAAIKGSYGF